MAKFKKLQKLQEQIDELNNLSGRDFCISFENSYLLVMESDYMKIECRDIKEAISIVAAMSSFYTKRKGR